MLGSVVAPVDHRLVGFRGARPVAGWLAVTGLVTIVAAPAASAAGAVPVTAVAGTSCPVFPADNVWHATVAHLPVNRMSGTWLRSMGASSLRLHPDFGPSFGAQSVPYGIPITVVGATHPKVRVRFLYASESDQVPYPLGPDTRIEGGATAGGDRHAVIVDRGTCRLYELWDLRETAQGWTAGSGATWSLTSDRLRPAGWTSADAAGLPILPGLVTWDEVRSGVVDHAIRFTTPITSDAYLWPARHRAGSTRDPAFPPMGARFRLRASFDVAGYDRDARVILLAMKTYGLILADNGSPWYFQGSADRGWPLAMIDELKRVPASAFQAVDESGLIRSPGSAGAR